MISWYSLSDEGKGEEQLVTAPDQLTPGTECEVCVAASLLTGRDIYTHHSLTSLVQDRHYPAACVKHHSRQQQLVALELSQYWALLTMPIVSTNLYGWTLFSDGSPLLYNFLSIIYLDTFRRSLNGNLNLCEYLIGLFLQIFSEDHKTKSYILFVFIISVLL